MHISADMLFWIQQKRWLLIALAIGAILYFFVPHPQSLGQDGYHILIIILMTLILILKEPIPLPAIALQLIFWQVIIGGSTANEVGGYFMNDAVFFIMGSLMLAVAIVSQGLDKRLALESSVLLATKPGELWLVSPPSRRFFLALLVPIW